MSHRGRIRVMTCAGIACLARLSFQPSSHYTKKSSEIACDRLPSKSLLPCTLSFRKSARGHFNFQRYCPFGHLSAAESRCTGSRYEYEGSFHVLLNKRAFECFKKPTWTSKQDDVEFEYRIINKSWTSRWGLCYFIPEKC